MQLHALYLQTYIFIFVVLLKFSFESPG